ncbi:uncharacterized protein METZ01_LOCUS511352, partial [marine metagenome]
VLFPNFSIDPTPKLFSNDFLYSGTDAQFLIVLFLASK